MSSTTANTATLAGVWTLQIPESLKPAESAVLPDDGSNGESIFFPDERRPVDQSDYMDGGKYRSIVKILARFEDKLSGGSVWMMGTGWLIRPDLLATAGHVVYDWGRHYGAVAEIKCYIGYNGRASINNPQVQVRHGKKVVTTTEWLQNSGNRHKDVAFIQVDSPFTGNLRIINFGNTPETDKAVIGVVGYPGDKYLKDETTEADEPGAQMYEQFAFTDYNLKGEGGMLKYRVSTFGGQSGAPIIRKTGKLTVIGTHCYGGGGHENNSGNAIGGPYGNNYQAFLSVFSDANSVVENRGNINIVRLGGPESFASTYQFSGGVQTEGFIDALKVFANVGSVAVPAVSSLIGGPLGGVLGSIAGTLLASVAGAESASVNGAEAPGAAERAVLAEAALQAVVLMKKSPESEAILERMEANWNANAPNFDAIAGWFAPRLIECALDVTVNKLNKATALNERPAEAATVLKRRPLTGLGGAEAFSFGDGRDFIDGLLAPTMPISDEEGIFDFVGPLLAKFAKYGGPIVSQAAKAAVSDVVAKLTTKITGKNSNGAEALLTTTQPSEEMARISFKRAVMGEVALQALMSLPRSSLEKLQLMHLADGSQPEGIFDFMKTVVQKIGPVALDTAKKAAKALAPILLDVVDKKTSSHLDPPSRGLRKQRSLMELLHGSEGNDNAVKVSHILALGNPSVDLNSEIRARENTWKSSKLRRESWDSNDDSPVILPDLFAPDC